MTNSTNSGSIVEKINSSKDSTELLKELSEEEKRLLDAAGLLHLLNEDNTTTNANTNVPSPPSAECSQSSNTHSNVMLDSSDISDAAPISNTQYWTSNIQTRLRNLMKWHVPQAKEITPSTLKESPTSPYQPNNLNAGSREASETKQYFLDNGSGNQYNNRILLGIGGTLFLLPHLAILLSLPPVLQRRGAPYLPTFKSKLNVMFDLIRYQIHNEKSALNRNLKFVDLGSGDGRVVFRAAREGLFKNSVGYEINPTLHLFAQVRKLFTPKYWRTTRFECRDLWNIQLNNYDVVAVYGLAPIMDRLGLKMKEELKPGSIIVSNVFEIPGWRTSTTLKREDVAHLIGKGVYLYRVPECFGSDYKQQNNEGTP